jgi:hypothetical protein
MTRDSANHSKSLFVKLFTHVQEELALDPSDPLYRTFNKIFQAFKISEPVPEPVVEEKEEVKQSDIFSKSAMFFSVGITLPGSADQLKNIEYVSGTKISLNTVRQPSKRVAVIGTVASIIVLIYKF